VDYETLMCLSGLAFSFYYQHDNFHVAYGFPNGWEDRIARATGFGWEWLPHKDVEDAWRILKESIDSDRVLWGEYMEGVTFAGYQDADRKEDRKVFATDPIFVWPGKWWTWAEFEQWWQKWAKPFPSAVGRHVGRVEMASARDMAPEVMRNVPVWSSDNGGVRRPPEARFGLAGIEAYAADIADTSKGEDYITGAWRGCHAINPQWTARKCPGVYLRRIAGEFQGGAREHILAAAQKHDASYAAWKEWAKHLGTDAPDEDALALHADARDKFREEAWQSPEHRRAGSAAVRRALEHEKEAVAEIEKALSLMEES
jgi:hypothetical protein